MKKTITAGHSQFLEPVPVWARLPRQLIGTMATVAVSAALLACGGGGGGGGGGGSVTTTPATTTNNGSSQSSGNAQATAFAAMHWATGPSVYASGAIATYLPSMATITTGKVLAVYAQSETGGNKLYSAMGDLAAGTWTAPTPITGFAGTVQGVSDISGWALNPSATVVSANPATGIATAAWTSQVTGEATLRVWMSAYSNAGGVWSTPAQIGTASVSGLKMTSSSAGGTLIGWLSASTVNSGTQALNLYTIPATGSAVSDLVELGASPYSAVKVGLSDANTVVAVWAGTAQTVKMARKSAGVWAATANLGTGAPASESDLDVVVNTDGSDAVAWSGIDPSVHTVVHDAAGVQTASQLIAQGSMGNTRPSLGSLGSGKYMVVFAASSLSSTGFSYHEPYSATYSPGVGWSAPIALYPTGVSGAGNQQLRIDTAGDALAINLGYNINGYSFVSGASAWSPTTNIVYGGAIPAFVQEKSTGRGVILWCSGSQLLSVFFK
jgi:hypothetical protein